MRIIVYSVCYNEEFMLPFFIDHYSFADKIVIYDNCSTDKSVEIMKKAGIQHILFTTGGKEDESYLTKVRNECWKHDRNYDLVMVVDIDEMIYPKDFKFSEEYTIFQPYGYQMTCDELPVHGKPIVEQVKTGVYWNHYDKSCIFNPRKIESMNWALGSHSMAPLGREGEIKVFRDENLKLLHYNLLTFDYYNTHRNMRAKRIGEYNRLNRLSDEVLLSDEKRKVWYDSFKNRATVVI